jgi:hypothetical protein
VTTTVNADTATSLVVAGALCLLLAGGHTVVGHHWILPRLRKESLPATPFGGPANTAVVLAIAWDIVTIAAVGMGVLLIGVAGRDASPERSLVLHTVAAIFAAAAATAIWLGRLRPRNLARGAPVWVAFIVVAVLCATSA